MTRLFVQRLKYLMVHQPSNIRSRRRRRALNCGIVDQAYELSIVQHMYLKALLFAPSLACLGLDTQFRGAHGDSLDMPKIE
jgi:hypothetical protein